MAVTIVPSLLHAGAVSATAFEITGGGGIEINPATAVDSKIQFKLQGTNHFTMGVDESTPNNDWVLSLGSALGTNNVWSVDGVSGVISFTGGLSYAGTDWTGNTITEGYGGTNQTTYTQGDLLYSSASNTLAKLALGNAGDQLKVNGAGNQVAWEAAPASGASVGLVAALAIVF
tara:strand:- start:165 stop:686 length:522 start_codon:yes stop_codon:yes gene_type:complete